MDARTCKALEDSIAHWERMTADPKCGDTPGRRGCALCTLFRHDLRNPCLGCPVSKRAGARYCYLTPYGDADEAWTDVAMMGCDYTPERRAAMQAEVDFLKSLRPEGEQ